MRQNFISLSIILLTLSFFSCNNTNKKSENLSNAEELIQCSNCDVKELLFETADMLFNDIQIVKLETTDSCFIGNIKQVEATSDNIIILDNYDNIYRFSKNTGAFLNKIGNRGQGPGEYISLNNFWINENQKSISFLTSGKTTLIEYGFDGKLLNYKAVSSEGFLNFAHIMPAGSGNFLLNNYMYYAPSYTAYTLINTDLNEVNEYFSYDIFGEREYKMPFSKHPMAKSKQSEIHMIMPIDNVVYEYKNGNVKSKYEIELPLQIMDKEQIAKLKDYALVTTLQLKTMETNQFPGFNAIYETNQKLILNFGDKQNNPSFFIAEKLEKRGHYYKYSTDPYHESPFFPVIASTDDYFISKIDFTDISKWDLSQEKVKEIKNKTLQDIINNMDMEDNPCLIFYK